MLAFDHRGSFKKMINPEDPESVEQEIAKNIKKEIISPILDQFTGILVDPEYGLPAYKELNSSVPFLLPIEKSGYTDKEGERVTEIEFGADNIKGEGASGVKILVYYNPEASTAASQIKIARQALDDAHNSGLPLFCEIVHYGSIDYDVPRSVCEFIRGGVDTDVYKLEFPGSQRHAEEITNLLGETPWILLTRGVDFDTFYEQLKISKEGGCKGFLAGRALWKEYFDYQNSPDQKQKFLTETLPERFRKISELMLS